MTREIISYSEFEEIVGVDNIKLYADCVVKGIEIERQINQFSSSMEDFVPLDKSTRAKIVHNKICGLLTQVFEGNPIARAGTWKQIFAVNFSNKVFIRHKKFKSKGKISAYKTKQHLKFLNQALIPGIPENPTFIIGGYRLNSSLTELIGVYFACYSGGQVEWFTNFGKYNYEQKRFDFSTNSEETSAPETKLVKPKRLTKLRIVSRNDDAKTQNENQ